MKNNIYYDYSTNIIKNRLQKIKLRHLYSYVTYKCVNGGIGQLCSMCHQHIMNERHITIT